VKKKELARKITSWLTLGAFSVQPMLAFAEEILPDNNAPIENRPLVTETASGNPLVQITTPTAGGVSVNRYEFFNVPERGAILNNSYGLASTELAGYVQGNPNLAAGTARIIVNEVTSANPSELRGFLEVAGDKAGVVIANPNGILADGAGFLNTARVTLATGRTEMDASGNLAAIRVEGGNLSVTGNGLNVQGVDSAEIYARAIEINAGLWAKNAKLAAGANEIRYADGTITPIKGTEDTPTYALDLAAIGGMYANRIELIGTEKGLGVNLAGQITSTEATSLDINGNLKTSGNLYTDGSTRIHANEIENSGAVYSKENTVLTASSLQNSGKIVGGADTAIHASAIANSGTLAAAIAPSGKTNEAGTLTVTAKEFDNNNAQLLSGKDITVSAENIRTQNSRIAANEDVSLVSQNALTVENTTIQSGKDLSIEANTMPLAGNLSSGRDMTIAVKSDLSNEAASEDFGNLHAGRNLTANIRGNIYNQKTMNADGTLSLTADGSLTQTTAGELSAEHLYVRAADLENHGLVQAKEETILHTAQLKNDATGGIYGRQINVQAKNGTEEDIAAAALYNSGKIISEMDTTIHAASVVNKGTLAAAIAPSGKTNDVGTLTVTAKELSNNNAQILSGKDIVVSAENLHTKSGQIAGNGDVSLTVKNALDIQNAALQSGRDLAIEADAMPLTGNLSSNRDMRLTFHGSGLSNEAAAENFGNLHAGRNLMANLQGNIRNQRKLEAGGALSLAATGNLTQTAAGEISGKNLDIHTADIENRGLVQADEETAITASNLKNDATGRIYGNTIDVQASHIRNEKNANLEARLAQEMHLLKEKAELLEAAHRVDVTKLTSWGEVNTYKANIQTAESAYDAQQKVVDAVKAELAALPSGVIAAREALALQANSIQNSGNALLYSGGDLSLAAKEEVANRGARIEAQGNISITAPLTKNENAAFSAKRVITDTKDNPVKLRIDEGGHIERGQAFPAGEFREINSGYGAYHSYVAPKAILEPAEYKPIEQISEEERAAGEKPIPDELIGALAPTYAYDDPIFKQFGIASMSTDRPAADDPARAAWDEAYKKILAKLNEKITAYNAEANAYNQKIGTAAGQKIIHFTVIRSHSILSKEHVTSSLPGSIRAGANILLNSAVENEDSNIVAGGTLRATGAVKEYAGKQQELAVTFGTTQGSYTERRSWLHKGKVRKYHGVVFMTPEITKSNPSPIGVQTYEGGNAASVEKADIQDAQRQRVQNALSPFGLSHTNASKSDDRTKMESLFVSSLYHVHPEATAKYLVETDPTFTNKRKFLSSDYMYRQMKWDQDKIPKRIGDGFYEQQLLADQILRQTGKRHLEGYTDDETAFKALMDAGISYAKEMNLAPGVALSKEQIASLTSDMIWLEEREVEVNGQKERAIYPVLYTKNTGGLKLTEGGSLVSAKNIVVETKEALKNAGTLYGENIIAKAGDMESSGLVLGKNITLQSDKDIRIQGSVLGEKSVVLEAKGNIAAKSTSEHLANQDVLNTTAGIAVKGADGVLVASAGKNIELVGATLSALGKNGSVLLSAGENITLDTKKLQSQKDMTENAENYLRTKRGTELGTEIRADGNISIAAGNDLKARAAAIASTEGTTSLAARKDITLTAGRETAEDHYGHRHTASGFLSSTRTTIRIDNATDEARGTLVTGKDVNLTAKQDVMLQAANVLADNTTNITAGRNFTAASEENYAHTDSFKEEKTSGIFSSGGLGFTIGTQQVKSERDSSALTQAGTNIAGFAGDVKITAGDTAHLTSASILAGKNASITAKETQIDGRENIYRDVLTQESRTTGPTISLGHGLLSLGQEIAAPLQRMGEVKDDRLKAVYAWKAGRLIHENFGKGQNPLKAASGFSLNLSLGTSKSYSRTESVTREYAGSKIAAGEKATLSAIERDLTIQGSKVEGKNVALTAKQNIQLTAGENSNHTTSENEASSAGIGVSFSPQGLSGLSLHASKAQGNSRENALTYTPTEIAAKDALQIESGKDMNILGSIVQGDKVTAKIGGNLNIETLQEKETYEEKNTSAGFDLSWDIRAGKFSKPTFGLSAGRGTIDSHYRSVRGQSGIFAGKGGFDIYVEKNTDLKGAIIASEATAGKNRLSTGTFSFSDLENEADYNSKSIGAEYHHYGSYDKMGRQEKNKVYNTIGLSPNLSMPAKGDANSTTNSAVAPGTIDIRENPTQDISTLNRDTNNALNELGRIFDKQKIEEQQELAKTFGEEAFRLAHNLPDDGSGRKIAVHAIIGGIMSQITGAGFASGAIGAGVNEAIIGEIKKIKNPGTAQIVSAIVGAAAAKAVGGNAGAGATAAASGTKWNFFGFAYRPDKMASVTEDGKHTIVEMVKDSLVKEDGSTLSETEAIQLLTDLDHFMMEQEPAKANSNTLLVEKFSNIVGVAERLHSLGYTEESVNHFLNRYTSDIRVTANGLIYFAIGSDSGFVDSEYIGKDFQFPNYIYDRSSVQSKEHTGIYGWKYVDDLRVAINKNGDIFLDDQYRPVVWEADAKEHPFAAEALKDSVESAVLFPKLRDRNKKEDLSKYVEFYLKSSPDPADFFGAGKVGKVARAVKPLAEPLVGKLSKVAADKVANELKTFQSKVWTIGTQKILLDKSGLKHILERHHPAFWAGKIKSTQTFLSLKTSVKDIEYTIQEVISQNRDKISNMASLPKFQIEGVIDGITYVVGFTKGRIGQFYIKK